MSIKSKRILISTIVTFCLAFSACFNGIYGASAYDGYIGEWELYGDERWNTEGILFPDHFSIKKISNGNISGSYRYFYLDPDEFIKSVNFSCAIDKDSSGTLGFSPPGNGEEKGSINGNWNVRFEDDTLVLYKPDGEKQYYTKLYSADPSDIDYKALIGEWEFDHYYNRGTVGGPDIPLYITITYADKNYITGEYTTDTFYNPDGSPSNIMVPGHYRFYTLINKYENGLPGFSVKKGLPFTTLDEFRLSQGGPIYYLDDELFVYYIKLTAIPQIRQKRRCSSKKY